METDRLPTWSIVPAAVKLLGSSLVHPISPKTITVDSRNRRVSVVSGNRPSTASRNGRKRSLAAR